MSEWSRQRRMSPGQPNTAFPPVLTLVREILPLPLPHVGSFQGQHLGQDLVFVLLCDLGENWLLSFVSGQDPTECLLPTVSSCQLLSLTGSSSLLTQSRKQVPNQGPLSPQPGQPATSPGPRDFAPGKVTAMVPLTRDSQWFPTSGGQVELRSAPFEKAQQ